MQYYLAKACTIAQTLQLKITADKTILILIILILGCGIDVLEISAHPRLLAVKKFLRA